MQNIPYSSYELTNACGYFDLDHQYLLFSLCDLEQ